MGISSHYVTAVRDPVLNNTLLMIQRCLTTMNQYSPPQLMWSVLLDIPRLGFVKSDTQHLYT